MIISGKEKYRSLVDEEACSQFFRAQGASSHIIEQLEIRFVEQFPYTRWLRWMGEPYGHAQARPPLIELATSSIEQATEKQKAFQALNRVLLHEALHICESENIHAQIIKGVTVVMTMAFPLLFTLLGRDLVILRLASSPLGQSLLTCLLLLVLSFLSCKIAYQLAPHEQRARKIMKEPIALLRIPIGEKEEKYPRAEY